MSKKTSNAPAQELTMFKIGKDDLVTVAGHKMRYAKAYSTGVVLRSANDNGVGGTVTYDWKLIEKLLQEGRLEIETGYFSERNAIMRASDTKCFELPPEKVLRVKMVAEFLLQEEGEADWNSERCHRSDKDIERFHAIFTSDKNNLALIDEARASITRKGKKKLFVGPRHFRRLIERFEEDELVPSSLGDRYPGGGSPGSRLAQPDFDFVLGYVNSARTPGTKTIVSAFKAMVKANEELKKEKKPFHRLVSLTTFQRMKKEASDYLNDVGDTDTRHPVERKYYFKRLGLEVLRPLEIVEMDEHKVHLMTMFKNNDTWDYLHEDVQERIEQMGRVWISAAMDACSRSIVGLKVLKGSPDADAAIATLAMVAQRKDKLSALLGAQTGWPQCGTPGAIHTDAGAAYIAAKFELAVMMYTGRHRIPPSKHPHLRGRVERFFGTINKSFIHLFSGETFSNVLMKGEYKPEKYAHVTDEEFADMIGRLIVDCYHNTKHRGIGMTPLEAWYRGSQLANGAVTPPPPANKFREIFGTTIKRSIGNSGIEIAGNIYSNAKLLEIRKKWYRAKLWVRLNEDDISTISVKHKRLNEWINVPAVFSGLKGVTLDEWRETVRYIDRHLGKRKLHSQEAVATALEKVQEMIALSKKQPGILVHDSLDKKLQRIEAEIGPKLRYNQPQPYDYGHYDDGIDHEEDENDNEELAAARLKTDIAERARSEPHVLAPAGGTVLNPGAGVEKFRREAFAENDARPQPGPSRVAERVVRPSSGKRAATADGGAKAKAGTPKREQPPAAEDRVTARDEAPKAKKHFKIHNPSTEK